MYLAHQIVPLLTDYRAPNESNAPPQFKLDIRNAPIQEEEGDADAALANMANTLRAVRLVEAQH